MSDFARLKDKLAKLRQRERVSGEGRKLRGAAPEERLSALVTEIDETILPRRLSFSVEGGETVHLVAASRKLQALVAPVPDVPGAEALEGQTLADADAPDVAALKDVLLTIFAGEAPVSIQSQRPDAGFASDVGVPAAVLARSWGLSEVVDVALDSGAVLARFLGDVADDTIAWLQIEGEEVTDKGGASDALDALDEQAANFLDGYFGRYEQMFEDFPEICGTALGPVGEEGVALFFVETVEKSVFLTVKPARLPEISMSLQKLLIS